MSNDVPELLYLHHVHSWTCRMTCKETFEKKDAKRIQDIA